MVTIILASESPRRRQLLAEAGYKFVVLASNISETPDKNLNEKEQILDIARRKARATLALVQETPDLRRQNCWILAADTEVLFAGSPLGKPESPDDAFKTLSRLSGTTHDVVTAVCLVNNLTGKELSHIETTRVTFRTLSSDEIKDYVATGEPMGKAGSYGIQGAAKKFVANIEGAFDNVVGLPVSVVKNLFSSVGVEP